MTSHGRSSCTTTSNMLITCGCCRRAPIRPSRMSRCRDSSSASPPAAVGGSAALSSSLTATVRFSSSSVPRQTDTHRARADALVEPIPVPDPGGIVSRRAHRSPGYPPPLDHLSPRPVSESGAWPHRRRPAGLSTARAARIDPRPATEEAGGDGATRRHGQVGNRGHDADRGHPRRQGRRGSHGTAVDHGGRGHQSARPTPTSARWSSATPTAGSAGSSPSATSSGPSASAAPRCWRRRSSR